MESALELEFPVSPGLDRLPPRIPIVVMIRRSRELRRWFPEAVSTEKKWWAAKRDVEFVL